MAISFGRAALAFTGGVARGVAEAEEEARKQKKLDERAYLDRYTQAAQNAMRFAETDRRERNTKVEGHRKNLGLISAALKQTGASDIEARQAAAQLYNQNRTAEGAKIASQSIINALEDAGDDADARRLIFDDMKASIDPNSTYTIEQFAQNFAGPRTTMQTYMPDMGTFDSRTKLQKLLGREAEESDTITQTRTMFESMGRKKEPLTSVTIPESDIKLPIPMEKGSAQEIANISYNRYEAALLAKKPDLAVRHLDRYDRAMERVQAEAAIKKAPKDPKAFITKDQYIKLFTQSGTREVFISQDNTRKEMLNANDMDYMGTREGVYRAYKYLDSMSEEDVKRYQVTRENFNAISKQFGFDNAADEMAKYDRQRLGASSLDVFVKKIEDASFLYKDDPQGKFLELDPNLRKAVETIYSDAVTPDVRNAYFEGIREAFFFPPVVGGTQNTFYSTQIRDLFPVRG